MRYPSPNDDLNRQIAAGILGCYQPELFDGSGVLHAAWASRLTTIVDDTETIVDEYLAAHQALPGKNKKAGCVGSLSSSAISPHHRGSDFGSAIIGRRPIPFYNSVSLAPSEMGPWIAKSTARPNTDRGLFHGQSRPA